MSSQAAPTDLEALFNPVVVTNRPDYFAEMGWQSQGYEVQGLYEALQNLSFHHEFQLDLETTGLGSFRYERALSLQLGVPGKQYVFDLESISLGEKGTFDRLLKDARVIGHNLAFDLPYLFHAGIVPKVCFDTILAEQLVYLGLTPIESRSKALGAVLKRHLNIDMDKSLQATINQGLRTVQDVLYAARDVWPLQALEEAMMPRIRQLGLYKRLALENRYLPVNAYLEVSGTYVDRERLKRWVRRVESEAYLQEIYMEETYGKINWNSPQQVAEILKQHGIEEYNEETGNAMTSDDVLQHRTEPIAQDLRKHRKAGKLLSTYGRKWFMYLMDDGRIHTKYKQLVETGRTSSGDVDRKKYDPYDFEYRCEKPFPNMQNLPRSKEFRACFAAAPGNVLVVCDYSSQESVILADQSEEPGLLKFFLEGTGDMHSYVTRLIWPELADLSDEEIKEHHSEKRTLAKTAGFAIAYGGNGDTIVANIGCDRETGWHVYNRYMEVFSGLPAYFKKCFAFAWQNMYMPTDDLTGGKRFFDNAAKFRQTQGNDALWSRYKQLKAEGGEAYENAKQKMKPHFAMGAELKKLSVNTKIQGTAAVMSKLAGVYFFEWIVEKGLFGKVKLPIFVHDEWVAECPKKMGEEVAAKLQECMERAGKLCLKHLTIKALPVICTHWEK